MALIAFTIEGNGVEPDGNALPKIRKTRGQSWTEPVQRYIKWKRYVQLTYAKYLEEHATKPIYNEAARRIIQNKKPIAGIAEASMGIEIYWHDERHGDPEGIFGSIADALFENDKHLAIDYVRFHHPEDKKGKVNIKINIH